MAQTPEQRAYSARWYAKNRERMAELARVRREQGGEAFLARQRAYAAKHKHGQWIAEDWAAMWEVQDGRCYLCGDDLASGKVHIDHDHQCCPAGRSCRDCRRGLACGQCNQAIGLTGDDPGKLRRIAGNLEAAQQAARARAGVRSYQPELITTGS